MGRMYGTCSECANRQRGKDIGNYFGPGCTAELDGVHPLGWGHQEEDEEPERNERGNDSVQTLVIISRAVEQE